MSGVSVKTKHVVYDFDPWIVLTRDLPSWIFSLKSSNDKILDLKTGGIPGIRSRMACWDFIPW